MGILSAILALHSIMMGKIAKTFRGNSKGQTLIEVLIALAILGIVVVAFMTALTTASRAIIVADEHTTAESLARSELEYVKSQNYEVTYDKIDLSGYPNYSIRSADRDGNIVDAITGVPWNPDSGIPSNDDKGIQKITVIIYHPYDFDDPDKTKKVLTLEDYKVDR